MGIEIGRTIKNDYNMASILKQKQNNGGIKSYKNAREYKSYLTDRYDCLRSRDYNVGIDNSVLNKALGDEKVSKWLEHNLSLIPKVMDNIRSAVEARGSKIISCNISIDGYDSMKTELVTRAEADPETEKSRKELEDKINRRREKKREEEKKNEEKHLEDLQSDVLEKNSTDSIVLKNFDQKI